MKPFLLSTSIIVLVLLARASGANDDHEHLRERHVPDDRHSEGFASLARQADPKPFLVSGRAFAYDHTTLTSTSMSNITFLTEKLLTSGDGFWTKAKGKTDSSGRFKQQFHSQAGTFRLRVIPKKSYEVDTDSYAMVQNDEGEKRKLFFNTTGHTPEFKARNGDVIVVSAKLAKYLFCIKGQVWEDKNRNGRRDSGEKPIKGAQIKLRVRRQPDLKKFVPVASAVTDKEGLYDLGERMPSSGGNYTLSVEVDKAYGFTWRQVDNYDMHDNDNDVDFDGQLKYFQIEPGQELKIDAGVVEKKHLSCVEGIVWRDDGDGIRKKFEDGRGLRYAWVILVWNSGRPDTTTLTNSTGGYKICAVSDWDEVGTLHVFKNGYKPTTKLNDHYNDALRDSDINDKGYSVEFHFPEAGEMIRIDAGLKKLPTLPSVKFVPFPHRSLVNGVDAACTWSTFAVDDTQNNPGRFGHTGINGKTLDPIQRAALEEGVCIPSKEPLRSSLHLFSTEEAIECLSSSSHQGRDASVVIAGDSYNAQLFVGLADILLGNPSDTEILGYHPRRAFVQMSTTAMNDRRRQDPTFPRVSFVCDPECYGNGSFSDSCSKCINSYTRESDSVAAVVGAAVHIKKRSTLKLQIIDRFLTMAKRVIFNTMPSYERRIIPKPYRNASLHLNQKQLYQGLLSYVAPQNQSRPTIDFYQLTGACWMKNCTFDGGHYTRYVNRWKAQLLLNTICDPGDTSSDTGRG